MSDHPHRPPSYDSQPLLPTSPSRIHSRRGSPTPTYESREDVAPPAQAVTYGRIRRLSDVEMPILAPTRSDQPARNGNRPAGARVFPTASTRSTSPDVLVRMPLLEKLPEWETESLEEVEVKDDDYKTYRARSTEIDMTSDSASIDDRDTDYGGVPTEPQPRRRSGRKTMLTEQVQLTQGNLVLDRAIPEKLQRLLVRKSDEFVKMRYTAITCDPDDFLRDGFTLRQSNDQQEIELVITLTMYNEDEYLLTRTLHSVFKNIAHLCSRTRSRTWGDAAWRKILVVIVADGRKYINPRVLDVLAAIGVYQEGLAQKKVDGRPVTAHLYEFTTQYSMTSSLQFRGSEKGISPVQIAFLMKENNAKKLNSHRWVFNGLCPLLLPNVVVLLDVGTKPDNRSIYHLWKAFDVDSRCAGAAGEIKISKGKAWSALLNPLVASQNFEYKMSNILDKPFESTFGYIAVLPGAFSAYRYHALTNDEEGNGPLKSYFRGEKLDLESDVFEKNMYLAEDRLLCLELVTKLNSNWLLRYVREASGETDCPDTIAEFIGQRRRWLNGATFAAIFALWNFPRIWHTSHSRIRKVFLHFEFLYHAIQLVFTFFGLANFYLTFYFITKSFGEQHTWGKYVSIVARYACIMVTSAQFILALGNRPKGAKALFLSSLIVYALIMLYTIFCSFYLGVSTLLQEIRAGQGLLGDEQFSNLVLSILSTSGVYFYMLLLPFYVCTLSIFSFSNIHDLSWGTKEEIIVDDVLAEAVKSNSDEVKIQVLAESDVEEAYEDALANLRTRRPIVPKGIDLLQVKQDYFREIRTRVVLVWLFANLTLMLAVSEYYGSGNGTNIYLSVIMYSVVLLTAIRFLGSLVYLVVNVVRKIGERRSAGSQIKTALAERGNVLRFWKRRSSS